jgi:FkbM family methyltransferase
MRRFLLIAPFILLPAIIFLAMHEFRSDCPLMASIRGGDGRSLAEANERAIARMKESRVDAGMEVWDTPLGQFWVPPSSASRLHIVIGEQMRDIYQAASMVHTGDVVMDCGADVGTFARNALSRGASRVIEVEPAPWKEPCLRKTFGREIAEGKVTIVAKGVWNADTELTLDDDTLREGKGVKVPLTTIDRIVDDLHLDRLDLIKMDIEGAEKPAIEGAKRSIRRFKPRLTIATEHKPDDFSAIPALLRGIVPSYTAQCGPCVVQFGRLQPYTMQFIAR